jgi:hypothetical protein
MSDQATPQPTFDVYVRHNNVWSLHNSHAGDQKAQAMTEAEALDQLQDNEGVRVMKTKDGSRSNRQDETLIWMSPWIAARKPKPKPKTSAAPSPGIEALADGPSSSAPSPGIEALADGPSSTMAPTPSTLGPPTPSAAVTAVSAATARAASAKLIQASEKQATELHFEPPNVKRLVNKFIFILILSIVITGAITIGIPMGFSFLASIGLPPLTPPSFSAGGASAIFVLVFMVLSFLMFKRNEFGISRTAAAPERPKTPAGAPPRPASARRPAAPRPSMAASTASADTPDPRAEIDAPAGDAPTKAEARYTMMGFLEGAINSVKDSHPRLDSHGALGMSLIVGGASRSYCRSMRLGKNLELTFLRDLARAIQVDTKRADQFCAKFEGFLQNPDASAMVAAGEDAMVRFTENDPDAFNKLAESMGHWQQLRGKAKQPRRENPAANGNTTQGAVPAGATNAN